MVESLRRGRLVAVTAARRAKLTHKVVVLGTAGASIGAGRSATVRIKLNGTGRALLAARHRLTAQLR